MWLFPVPGIPMLIMLACAVFLAKHIISDCRHQSLRKKQRNEFKDSLSDGEHISRIMEEAENLSYFDEVESTKCPQCGSDTKKIYKATMPDDHTVRMYSHMGLSGLLPCGIAVFHVSCQRCNHDFGIYKPNIDRKE